MGITRSRSHIHTLWVRFFWRENTRCPSLSEPPRLLNLQTELRKERSDTLLAFSGLRETERDYNAVLRAHTTEQDKCHGQPIGNAIHTLVANSVIAAPLSTYVATLGIKSQSR